MILATVGNKGEEQIKFGKKLPQVGIKYGTLGLLLCHILFYTLMPSSLS